MRLFDISNGVDISKSLVIIPTQTNKKVALFKENMVATELKQLNPWYLNSFDDGEDGDDSGAGASNADEKELGENMDGNDLDLESLDNEFIEEADNENA